MVADDFHGISPVQILIMILPSGKRLQKTMENQWKSQFLIGKTDYFDWGYFQ